MQLLRIRDVCNVTGLSRSGVYEAMKEGTFPRSVRIARRAVAWRSAEINTWLESRPVSITADQRSR